MTTRTAAPDSRLRKFRPDIEGLRFIAMAMVGVHHLDVPVFGGVDISFALSAFLATTILLRMTDDPEFSVRRYYGRYYASRFRRLFPAAAVVIVTTLFAAWLWLPAFRLKSVAFDGLASALSFINWRLLAQQTDYFAEHSSVSQFQSPLQHFWSLAIEEQFYLLYPTMALLLVWIGRKLGSPRWALGIGLVAATGVSLYLSAIITQASQPQAYFGFHTRAWELGIGALAGLLSPWFARMWQWLAAIMSWAGLAAIGVGSWIISQTIETIPGTVMLWPVVGAVLVMAGGCAHPRFGAEMLLGRAVIRFGGRVSYSWYLWHWPVIIIAPYALGRDLALWEGFVALAVAFGLAIITYNWVEKPVKARKTLVTQPRKGLAFGGGFVVASVWGAVMLLASTYAYAGTSQPMYYADPASIGRQVADATKATQLSGPASRRLEGIKNDLYPGCIVEEPETVAKSCALGDAHGTSQMVLFGSSLAWQWIPTFKGIATERHTKLDVFAKAGCPAEDYVVDALAAGSKGAYNECAPWRVDAYAKIARLKPNLVVLASRAEERATPAAIEKAVRYFQSLGAAVVLLQETPRFAMSVPDCLSKPGGTYQECVVAVDKLNIDHAQRNMAAAAAQKAGATVVDPLQWLCAEGRCPPAVSDMVVYWDDHHLTASFALWLTRLMEAALKPVLSPLPTPTSK